MFKKKKELIFILFLQDFHLLSHVISMLCATGRMKFSVRCITWVASNWLEAQPDTTFFMIVLLILLILLIIEWTFSEHSVVLDRVAC